MKSPHEFEELKKCQQAQTETIEDLMEIMQDFVHEREPQKVVLVDDDPDFLEAFSAYCFEHGYSRDKFHLVTATNSEELKMILKDNGDPILLLDIHLKNENGLHLATELDLPSTYKVFFLSAKHTPEKLLNEVQAAGGEFISKPTDPDDYKGIFKRILK